MYNVVFDEEFIFRGKDEDHTITPTIRPEIITINFMDSESILISHFTTVSRNVSFINICQS